MIEIHIELEGAAIGKWLRGPGGAYAYLGAQPIAEGLVIIHADAPVYVDRSARDVPYFDSGRVVFSAGALVYDDWEAVVIRKVPTDLLDRLQDAGVPVDEAEAIRFEYRRRYR